MVRLQLLHDGQVAHAFDLGQRPMNVGRGPNNDVILNDDTVSWHHAVVWVEGGTAWLRDAGSTNGSFINDRRVRGPERLQDGDLVRLGTRATLKVHGGAITRPVHQAYVIEDATTGHRFPLVRDRFHIGSAPDSDVHIPDAPPRLITILRHANGEVWCGSDDGEEEMTVGTPFRIGDRAYILREAEGMFVPTVQPDDPYPYRLVVTLDGATGPQAALAGGDNATYRVDSGNRAVLLYVLARRYADDKKAGKTEEDRGWCSDEEIKTSIWGRGGDDNKLHVLLYRLRSDLRKAGFDPWFIEKRHRFIRLRLPEVEVG